MDVGGSFSVAWCVCVYVIWLVITVSIEHNSPMGPGLKMTFELTSNQGAALMANHPTYREDAERERNFRLYTKRHYESWVDFARKQGHGDDEIKPVLVTGV